MSACITLANLGQAPVCSCTCGLWIACQRAHLQAQRLRRTPVSCSAGAAR